MFGAKKDLKAVDGVSFNVRRGETFGLVGESGSGKSTIGRSIIKLYDPTGGKITFDGRDITNLDKKGKMELTNDMQMIFQDPFASVNPRLTVEQIIGEGIRIHQPEKSKEEIKEKVIELLEKVGLNEYHISRYPHEFSGGQLQRVGIARSLAVKPKFIIADESISALDVSIQAQVVNLMKQLQNDFELTFLFIAHDLSMVKYISDTIGVMYKGKLLELASADEIYDNPVHPYTKSLLSAIPHTDPMFEKTRTRITYDGSMHDYDLSNPAKTPKEHQLSDTHRVYCSDEELAEWTK
ncbi:ATP-binding cassette domain-containing protein [Mollicutes bacterium LVI A0039]|nr:ATP-binding cassette domain-containing protein [Mollicutes bacterium LVI A0039]